MERKDRIERIYIQNVVNNCESSFSNKIHVTAFNQTVAIYVGRFPDPLTDDWIFLKSGGDPVYHLRDKTNVGQKISVLIATYCDALWAPKWGNKDKCRRYYHLLQGLRNETGLASRNQIKAKISFILSDENGNLFSSPDFGSMMRVMHQLTTMTMK